MKYNPTNAKRLVPATEIAHRAEAARSWPVVQLFGLSLACASQDDMARHIVARAAAGKPSTINFVNAHCINQQHKDAAYGEALAASDLLLPDGVGMEIAARMSGQQLGENLNGTDLFPKLCNEAARQGSRMFLLGGMPGVADSAAAWAVTQFPALRIAGTHSGYFDAADEEALIERINCSGADIILVGFGVPLQETWIARNRHRLQAAVVMGVGGLFDYYSSRIPRAPELVRACKSEWMWRLAMEPRRMAARYLIGNAVFLVHAAQAAAKAHGAADMANEAGKRALDVIGAGLAILALLPIFIVTALSIWLEDKGPVLFRQIRIGENGKPFRMIKFRSMYSDAEERRKMLLSQSERDGTCFKMRNDPRITRTGRIIRRFSIDELPQLFNVLFGTMSLVGPRPALPSEVTTYDGRNWQRLAGKPGITCTWQVRGRAEIPFARQAIMDRAYLKRTNLWVDIKLLLCTPAAVLGGRGAY